MTRERRKWIYEGDELDRDCIHKFEYILGRKLKDYQEYLNLDSYLDDMILDYNGRKDFYAEYPEMKKYRTEFCTQSCERR